VRNVVNHGTIIGGGGGENTRCNNTLPNQTDRARGTGIEMKKGGWEEEEKGRERVSCVTNNHSSSIAAAVLSANGGISVYSLIHSSVCSFIHARGVG